MICKFCKLMYNPLKREMLMRIYSSRGGVNVAIMAEEMSSRGLVSSGVTQYLHQLEAVGVIRRERSGRYVNYLADATNASPDVRMVVEELFRLHKNGSDSSYDAIFGALMNPFRAHVVSMIAEKGAISGLEICEMTNHISRYLKRDLELAVKAGLIWADDSEPALVTYRYSPSTDPFVRLLVSLC